MPKPKNILSFSLDAVREYLSYDPKTGEIRWAKDNGGRYGRKGDIAGSIESNGYRRVCLGQKRFLAHRLAWFMVYGEWPKSQIDHINGSRSDNRIDNLRQATPSQNQANKGLMRNNISGFRGVRFHKKSNKFCASIVINGEYIWLGTFNSQEEAVSAQQAAMAVNFGEYAKGYEN